STPGSSRRTIASSPSLTISAAGLKPSPTGLSQSVAGAGPKKSRIQRSTSQAGRDHKVRLLIRISSCLVVADDLPAYPYEHESTTLKFHLVVRLQRTTSDQAASNASR